MVQHYLVIETEYIFDSYLEPYLGHSIKFITTNSVYLSLNGLKYYCEVDVDDDLDDVVEVSCEDLYPQNGDISSAFKYKVKGITAKEADRITTILDNYRNI